MQVSCLFISSLVFRGAVEFHCKNPLVLVCFPVYVPENKEKYFFQNKYSVICYYVSAAEIKQLDQRDPLGQVLRTMFFTLVFWAMLLIGA